MSPCILTFLSFFRKIFQIFGYILIFCGIFESTSTSDFKPKWQKGSNNKIFSCPSFSQANDIKNLNFWVFCKCSSYKIDMIPFSKNITVYSISFQVVSRTLTIFCHLAENGGNLYFPKQAIPF